MTYLEMLVDSVLDIIDSEGINPISIIHVNESVYRELTTSQSMNAIKQTIGYPVRMRYGMVQPYRIYRKRRRRG